MSTRSQIGFYEKGEEDLTKWEALLYRHCDGYPSGMLPELQPFLAAFAEERGLDDTEYAAARCMGHFCAIHKGATGYGICKNFHGDIEYFYAVYPDRLDVYSVTGSGDPNRWKKIMSLKIGEVPENLED